MRKYLLPESGNFYKANLHCHTSISDGRKTPEQVKEIYKSLGYSVVAYTDHDVLIPHNDLCDDEFLALNAFEIGILDSIQNIFKNCPFSWATFRIYQTYKKRPVETLHH